MNRFKAVFGKNINLILKTEVYFFLFLIIISGLYQLDGEAHRYYNTGPYWDNIHSFFSLIIILLFGLYFWICTTFPVIWLLQSVFILRFNLYNRKRLWLSILSLLLYSITIAMLFSLYSIGQRQRFKQSAFYGDAYKVQYLKNNLA